jgi:hypothetical protein
MFCPKCGTKNPENGKFCRSCGTDLSPVSSALAGKKTGFGMIEPVDPIPLSEKKGKSPTWENALSTFFAGLAFLIVSIILGVTNAINSSKWWFWLLIPAFAMIGTGIAQIYQLKREEQKLLPNQGAHPNTPLEQPDKAFAAPADASAPPLPPAQTDYIAPQRAAETRYKTGDLVPPSVTENTTRHLEINHEGETMTLPKK